MRKFTLLSLATILASQTINAQAPQRPAVKLYPSVESTCINPAPASLAIARAQAKSIMRPAKEDIYYTAQTESGWAVDPSTTYSYTYDEKGRVKTRVYCNEYAEVASQKYERNSYEYNDDGNVTSELLEYSADGETWTPNLKTEYKFDTVVKDLIVSTMQYQRSNVTGELTRMVSSNCQRTDVQRDEKGRVTLTTIYRYDDKKNEYVYQRITPTYDEATGHPSEIVVEDQLSDGNDGYVLGELKRFRNLVWQECDDQFVSVSANYRSGSSRATAYRYNYRGVDYGDYKITYGENAPEYEATYTYLDGTGGDVMSCKLLDENGSFYVYDKSWWDKNGDKTEDANEIALSKYTYYYNKEGKLSGEEQWGGGYGDALTLYYARKDVYTYSDEYDYKTEVIGYTWDWGTPVLDDGSVNWKPSSRTVYSDFTKVGEEEVDAIGSVKNGAKGWNSYTLYDLQGRKVESGAMNSSIASGKHGVFVLQLTNGSETKSVKITK